MNSRASRHSIHIIAAATLLIASALPVQGASAQRPSRRSVPGARPSVPSPEPTPQGTQSATPAPLAEVSAGKFRITINGFVVNSATRDHILDIDGVGDEVYISANVIVMDASQNLATPLATLESRVYGEARRDLISGQVVWPGRWAAGSGTRNGGLRTGNKFPPTAQPWRRGAQASAESLPLEVWCGTLTQGKNAVVMIPSIWEFDGVSSTFGDWAQWGSSVATDLSKNAGFVGLVGLKGSAVTLGAQLALGAAITLDSVGLVGGERDRPIGLQKARTKAKTFEFTPPHKFLVTYESADFSTRENASGSVGSMSPGTYALQYTDDGFFQGRYTLYVQIERIDAGKCSHEYVPNDSKKYPRKPTS